MRTAGQFTRPPPFWGKNACFPWGQGDRACLAWSHELLAAKFKTIYILSPAHHVACIFVCFMVLCFVTSWGGGREVLISASHTPGCDMPQDTNCSCFLNMWSLFCSSHCNSHMHSLALACTHTHTLSLSLSLSVCLSLSLSHTHTHTHTFSMDIDNPVLHVWTSDWSWARLYLHWHVCPWSLHQILVCLGSSCSVQISSQPQAQLLLWVQTSISNSRQCRHCTQPEIYLVLLFCSGAQRDLPKGPENSVSGKLWNFRNSRWNWFRSHRVWHWRSSGR